jgi:hypothetical protein
VITTIRFLVKRGKPKMKIVIETNVTLIDRTGHTFAAGDIIRDEIEYFNKDSARRLAEMHKEKVILNASDLIKTV